MKSIRPIKLLIDGIAGMLRFTNVYNYDVLGVERDGTIKESLEHSLVIEKR